MFDVLPYWMWAASLLVLALLCGIALSVHDARSAMRHTRHIVRRIKWRAH